MAPRWQRRAGGSARQTDHPGAPASIVELDHHQRGVGETRSNQAEARIAAARIYELQMRDTTRRSMGHAPLGQVAVVYEVRGRGR